MKRVWVIGLFAIVGCGPREVTKFNAAPPPPAEIAGDWRTLDMPDIAATISAPTDWRTPAEGNSIVDMSQAGGEGQMPVNDDTLKNDLKIPDEMIKERHEAEKLPAGTSLLLMKRGIVGETSYITEIEVKHKKVDGGTTLKAEADEVASRYLGESQREPVQLPVGPAERISKQTKSVDGETGHHIHYVLVNNEDVYVITLQTEQQEGVISDIAQKVAESFRLKK